MGAAHAGAEAAGEIDPADVRRVEALAFQEGEDAGGDGGLRLHQARDVELGDGDRLPALPAGDAQGPVVAIPLDEAVAGGGGGRPVVAPRGPEQADAAGLGKEIDVGRPAQADRAGAVVAAESSSPRRGEDRARGARG